VTPTPYLSITPLQEPFDLGLDDAGMEQCAFNVVCMKRPSGTFLEELLGILVAAGVGIANVSIFASSKAILPDASAPGAPPAILHLKATGGTPPIGTHNDGAGAYRRPGVQLIVRAASWPAAYAMAQAAYSALIAVRNQAVSA
jgi:hypothetical protein